MKSTKVKIGFLLAALAAVLFTGCNQLTTKNLPTEFGIAGRTERIAQEERLLKNSAWNTFYTQFTSYPKSYNLQTQDITKDKIEDLVKEVNKALKEAVTKKPDYEHKFDGMKKLTTVVYAELTYTGNGESKDVYTDLKTGRDVQAKFSQKFDIKIHGDIGKYLDESVGAGK